MFAHVGMVCVVMRKGEIMHMEIHIKRSVVWASADIALFPANELIVIIGLFNTTFPVLVLWLSATTFNIRGARLFPACRRVRTLRQPRQPIPPWQPQKMVRAEQR